ncbi:MAG: hypothetical protein VB111_06640 [Clostridiaceae bacterium]|nr:hypothetical protein [Clostridiaceae bacterium]
MPEIKEGDTLYDPNLTTQGQDVPEIDEGKELCPDTPEGTTAHKRKQDAPIETAPPMTVHKRAGASSISKEELVRSVIMAEVLAKPLALRKGGRRI